jgi:hypothetical protein
MTEKTKNIKLSGSRKQLEPNDLEIADQNEIAGDNGGVGAGNAGLRLLDALFDDIGYARYLLLSKKPQDSMIKRKIDWKDQTTGASLLHIMCYSDLNSAVKLLLQNGANPNIRNKVRHRLWFQQ